MSIERHERDRVDFSDVVEPNQGLDEVIAPGEILLEDLMAPIGLSAAGLARELHVPANRVTAILKGERSITADTALRLSGYFGTAPEFWMRLQADYDLRLAQRTVAQAIVREVKPRAA